MVNEFFSSSLSVIIECLVLIMKQGIFLFLQDLSIKLTVISFLVLRLPVFCCLTLGEDLVMTTTVIGSLSLGFLASFIKSLKDKSYQFSNFLVSF